MNNNYLHENSGTAETLFLNEESGSDTDNFLSIIKSFLKRIRVNFAKKSEKSILSALLGNLYVKTLYGRIRVAAVFLLTLSVVSLAVSYISNTSFGAFLADIDTFSSLILFVISLMFFTSNKSLYNLISTSRFLSALSIVYSDSSLLSNDYEEIQNISYYSTPFFLGIIFGIFTVIYPATIICTFIVSLICVLLIFNRPECGLLITIAVLPLLNRQFLVVFVCFTFISLLYKFLLGKRHITFNISTLLIITSFIYITVRCVFDSSNTFSIRFFTYLVMLLACLTAMNLVRSTAMFRRTVLVLLRMTRIFTIILVSYYLCNMFLGSSNVTRFMQHLKIDNLIHSLTSAAFAAPFLAMSMPLNFAYLVGINKKNEIIKNLLFVILLLACLIYVSSYLLVLICILACVGILIFFNKKYGFLIIPAPFAAYALQRIFDAVPSIYKLSASSESVTDINTAVSIFMSSPFFGKGPAITDYNGNMALNILITFGAVGLILLSTLLVSMTIKTVKSFSVDSMKSDKTRFLSIGLLCSQLSFISVCLFTNIYCDMNTIYMFAVILTVSFVSGKCYDADYIDETIVREYKI